MRDDILAEANQGVLKEVRAFLEKLSIATKVLESSETCIDLVLPIMDYVLKQLEATKEKNEFHIILSLMLNSGQSKFNTYYEKTNKIHAYVAVLVLNPKYKQ